MQIIDRFIINRVGSDPEGEPPHSEINILLSSYNRELNALKPLTRGKTIPRPNEIIFESYKLIREDFISESVNSTYEKEILSYRPPGGQYPDNILSKLDKAAWIFRAEISASKYFLCRTPGVDCIKLYSSNSPFQNNLNINLCSHKYNNYLPYLRTLLYYEKQLDSGSLTERNGWVYMGRCLELEDLREYYKLGYEYYFSCFVSTTYSLAQATSYMLRGVDEGLSVLFKIKLDTSLNNNKYDLYNINPTPLTESTILLLPFFKFRVIDRQLVQDPHTQKPIVIIILEEVWSELYGKNSKHIQISEGIKICLLWAGKGVNLLGGKYLQSKLLELGKLFGESRVQLSDNIENTREILISTRGDRRYIVITDGFGSQNMIKEIANYISVYGTVIFKLKKQDSQIPLSITKHKTESNTFDLLYNIIGTGTNSFELILNTIRDWILLLQSGSDRPELPSRIENCCVCGTLEMDRTLNICNRCIGPVCANCATLHEIEGILCKICIGFVHNPQTKTPVVKELIVGEHNKELIFYDQVYTYILLYIYIYI